MNYHLKPEHQMNYLPVKRQGKVDQLKKALNIGTIQKDIVVL